MKIQNLTTTTFSGIKDVRYYKYSYIEKNGEEDYDTDDFNDENITYYDLYRGYSFKLKDEDFDEFKKVINKTPGFSDYFSREYPQHVDLQYVENFVPAKEHYFTLNAEPVAVNDETVWLFAFLKNIANKIQQFKRDDFIHENNDACYDIDATAFKKGFAKLVGRIDKDIELNYEI
jgi:hypothetical protein